MQKELTYRTLRQALTAVENQDMTIRELRALLVQIEEQDEAVDETEIMKLTYNK